MSPSVPLLLLLFCLCCVSAPLLVYADGDPYIWPLPQQVTYGDTTIDLVYPFPFVPNPDSDDLDAAIARYTQLIFSHNTHTNQVSHNTRNHKHGLREDSTLQGMVIHVDDLNAPLSIDTDESYTLTITTTLATLTAKTYYGALRGLETFAQIVSFDYETGNYQITQAPWSIIDFPRFTHRGVMIDTARHYLPLPTLQMMIDALSYAKFNVLHWHLTDSQSFPYHSKTFPLLANGAWSPTEQYTLGDIAAIIEYARQRGVRILTETDVPGHAQSWCKGYPEICPSPTCQSPLDPTNELTFQVIRSVLQDLANVNPYNSFVHVGGDEVDATCWNTTQHIRDWMTQRNYTLHEALWYFTTRVHDIAVSLNLTVLNWDEVYATFGLNLDHSTSIVHVWRLTQLLINATNDGYRAVVSVDIPWYLGPCPWRMMYATDPWDGIYDAAKRALVLGGETCMWGEQTDNSNLFRVVWPSAAAVAEKLWSAWEVDDVDAAEPRYAWFRCYLNSRGIGAAPYNTSVPMWSMPPGPGSCFDQ